MNTPSDDPTVGTTDNDSSPSTDEGKPEITRDEAEPKKSSFSGNYNAAFEPDLGVASTDKSKTIQEIEAPTDIDDHVEREQWSSPLEFLLSCVAMSVGLGNIYRFPYQAYNNGGGAFLIPYLLVLTFIGRPIYFLELSLGQFSSYGQTKIWKLAPFFKGVGYGSMFAATCVVVTYAQVIVLTIYYFFASMQGTLPWAECNNDTVYKYNPDLFCLEDDIKNVYSMNTSERSQTSLSEVYFIQEVLQQKDSIDDGIGTPIWSLTLCLLLAWLCIWGALVKGVSSAGKVAYFTALFPYVVLIIMLVRGVTLPGAWEGIKYFIKPDWEKMLEPEVWYAAVAQCFFSLGTGFGPIIMFSSYNNFSHNIYRDAWILSFLDTFTSLLAGFTIFSVLGFLAHELDVEVPKVALGGPGLTFISFAQALSTFEWAPQFFSVLFFLMLFTLGIGTATSLAGGIITIICDQFTHLKKWMVTSVVCVAGFLIGLMFVTPGGPFVSDLIGYFGADFVVYVMATVEVGAVAYVYGLNNFLRDINFMLGIRLGLYWKICWLGVVPVGLTAIFIYALATMEEFKYSGVPYPRYVLGLGWMLAVLAILIIPAFSLQAVYKSPGSSWKEKFKASLKPTEKWGPRSAKKRKEWEAFKESKSSTF